MLSLAVWQDTCHTYKNLVYDLAHHESPIAQWLERPTGTWKVMGSTPIGGSENSFSEYLDLRMLLHYLLPYLVWSADSFLFFSFWYWHWLNSLFSLHSANSFAFFFSLVPRLGYQSLWSRFRRFICTFFSFP